MSDISSMQQSNDLPTILSIFGTLLVAPSFGMLFVVVGDREGSEAADVHAGRGGRGHPVAGEGHPRETGHSGVPTATTPGHQTAQHSIVRYFGGN